MKKTGLVEITFEFLEDRLNLKDGIEIIDVFVTDKQKTRNSFYAKISGDNLTEIAEGYEIYGYPLIDLEKRENV